MAVVLLCNKLPHNDHTFRPSGRELDNGIICKCSASSSRRFSSSATYVMNRLQVFHPSVNGIMKRSTVVLAHLSQGNLKLKIMTDLPSVQRAHGQDFCTARNVMSCCANEKQLGSLDSYFEKLQGEEDQPSSDSCDKITDLVDEGIQMNVKAEVDTLNSYIETLDKDETGASKVASDFNVRATEETPAARTSSVSKDTGEFGKRKQESFMESRNKDVVIGSTSSQALHNDNETSDLYFIGLLASINIAVFLFEVASPIRDSELYSLPLAYGAKINDLIMVGEWWRLITPMFLVHD